AQLYRQAMRIPAGFTLYLKALHGFVAAYHIFQSTRNHMVNTGHSICRRRPFVKHKCRRIFSFGNTFLKEISFFPNASPLLLYGGHIQLFIFFVLIAHLLWGTICLKKFVQSYDFMRYTANEHDLSDGEV